MPKSLPLLEEATVCCSSVTGGALDVAEAERLARMFQALGDPTRVRLLSMIAAAPGQEACICDLVEPVGLSQPRSDEHTSELHSLMRISYAVFCFKKTHLFNTTH